MNRPTLSTDELCWRDKQPWLLSCGYQVRPRFRPDWVPSWEANPGYFDGIIKREDSVQHRGIAPRMDAIRIFDNKAVMLKQICSKQAQFAFEHKISEYVSSPEQLQDPDNHCVPIYEILKIPNDDKHVILVMPLLRQWDNPRFDTIGECLDVFLQIFKGLRYLHQNRIAHRDCTGFNLMMDGSEMYPDGFHPVKQNYNRDFTSAAVQKYTRTQCPPKYYWIDFGLSVPFDKSDKSPQIIPVHAGDKSAPEYKDLYTTRHRQPVDPFPTDIYYLGNMVRMYFTEGSQHFKLPRKLGFEFMEPLVQSMVQNDPQKRPTIEQCVIQLEDIIQSQPLSTLRSQVRHATDNSYGFFYRLFPHWARRVVFIITQTPALPSVSRPPSVYLVLYTRLLLAFWVIVPLAIWYYPNYREGAPSIALVSTPDPLISQL